MSFDGIYTISFNNTGTLISATLGQQSVGLSLLLLDKNNSQQKWSIRPIGNVGDNIYTIQSAYTGAYVIPQGTTQTFTYGENPFGWLINDNKISTTTLPPRNWFTDSSLKAINLGTSPATTWEIKPVV